MKASSQLTSVWVSGKRGAGGAGCCSCELSDHSSPTEHGLRTRRGHPPHPASTAPGPGDEAGGSKNFRFGAGVEIERCYTIIIWSSSIHSPPTAAAADPLSPEQLHCDHINCYKKVVVFQRQNCIILTSMDPHCHCHV